MASGWNKIIAIQNPHPHRGQCIVNGVEYITHTSYVSTHFNYDTHIV